MCKFLLIICCFIVLIALYDLHGYYIQLVECTSLLAIIAFQSFVVTLRSEAM